MPHTFAQMEFRFCKSNLTIACGKLKPCTFCILHAQDNMSGNCVRLIADFMFDFMKKIEVLRLAVGTQLLILSMVFAVISYSPELGSLNLI